MKTIRLLNIFSVAVTIVINILANALPLNNISTGEISDSFPTLFTPAGYVFAIWGIIYLGLIAFTIYQVLPSQANNQLIKNIGPWFILANLFNSGWIFLWHYGYFTATLLVMLGLLLSLLIIYQKIRAQGSPAKLLDSILIKLPFSIYLGWITVATVANFSVALYNLGYRGAPLTQEIWTVSVIGVAVLLGILLAILRREVAYVLVLIWAFGGIVAKQAGYPIVVMAGNIAIIILSTFVIYNLVRSTRAIKSLPK